MEKEEDKIRKSLWYSILDGTFYSSMLGFGESFFSAFAVFLKANNPQLGLLSSLPHLLGSLSQLYTHKLLEIFNSRKKLICISVLLQALMYIPVALVFFFGTFKVYHLILFICLYWVFGAIISPAWNSWMGDLVDEKERGRYFGKRNKITGFVSFATFLMGGFILQKFSGGSLTVQYMGFAVIFLIALVSRIISLIYLAKKYEPEYKAVDEAEFGFLELFKQEELRNFSVFAVYLCFMNFATFVAAPFFAAYMLYDLKFDYGTFTIVTAAAILAKFLMMPIWGKLLDRYGAKKILTVSGFLMPAVPLWWVFSSNTWYLIVAQAYSGFIWAGFELASFNFIFDTTSRKNRATSVAYYNVLNGIFIFGGAMAGGFIVRHNQLFWSKYIFVFVLSTVLRYIVSFMFIAKIKEVRNVEKISTSDLLLKIMTMMTTKGMMHSLITFKDSAGLSMEKEAEERLGILRKYASVVPIGSVIKHARDKGSAGYKQIKLKAAKTKEKFYLLMPFRKREPPFVANDNLAPMERQPK